MAVYVDDLREYRNLPSTMRGLGRRWCHMWADTDRELDRFAVKIGLRRSWLQLHRVRNHYDLNTRRRGDALHAGAVRNSLVGFLRDARKAPRGP
jgi:hypothetical protein